MNIVHNSTFFPTILMFFFNKYVCAPCQLSVIEYWSCLEIQQDSHAEHLDSTKLALNGKLPTVKNL